MGYPACRAARPGRPKFALDRTPGRRLRVGYVSPDFRQHAVALFAEPLLAAHDRTQVELFCYAEVPVEDATTHASAPWQTIGVPRSAAAMPTWPTMVRADAIDVLVDLAGHTAGNRLLVFARKPAPVQIEYILGHGYTSGLSAIDAFLRRHDAGPARRRRGVQRAADPPAAHSPGVSRRPPKCRRSRPCPPRRKGFVTFGYFGRTVRLNDGCHRHVVAHPARGARCAPAC